MKTLAWFAALFLVFGFSIAEAKKVALVIGNSAYEYATPLANPKNDAEDMAARLEELGFEVVSGLDLDYRGMRKTVRSFANSIDGAELALFFYAGHGLQVNGQNYMAPIDARLASEIDLEFEAVPINLVLGAMERATEVNLVFLDACRDNPLARSLARSMGTRSGSVGRGLAKLGSGIGSLISFATQPGNVALDGEGRNSPFTTALLEHLGEPGRDITRELIHVRRAVIEQTDGKQVPWDNSSLTGEVILNPESAEPIPDSQSESRSDDQFEIAFWNSIKEANTKAYFETYLQQYTEGRFAPIARLKIMEIEAAATSREDEERLSAEAERLAAEKLAAQKAAEEARMTAQRQADELAAIRKQQEAEAVRLAEEKAKAKAEREAYEKQLAELEARKASAEAEAARRAAQESELAAQDRMEEIEVAALEQPESDPLAEEPQIDPREDRELVRSIQTELNRVGCSAGRPDGIWGRNTERGIKNFGKHAKVASVDPSPDLLKSLEAQKARVCPLVCSSNQEIKNGRCVNIQQQASAPRQTETRSSTSRTTSSSSTTTSSGQTARAGRVCMTCRGNHRKLVKACFTKGREIIEANARGLGGCR